jgi:hypothetical protein
MRGFRSTLILLVVLAGLLGYIYYYMKPGSTPPVEQKPKVFTADANAIEEIAIASSRGERTTVRKVDGVWQVVEPVQAKADETEISGLTTNIVSLENQRVIEENAADLAQYGLATPRVEVAFRRTGDKEPARLLVGDRTATGGDLYAKLPGEKKVFLISSFLETTFDRSTFDLRDKAILAFDRAKVERVEVASAAQDLAFTKAGDAWSITRPLAVRADGPAVDGLIGRLQTGQMKSIVAPDAATTDLKQYGLDKPAATVTLGAGSTQAALLVGAATADGTGHYARDAARAMVFTIEKSLVDDLAKKADEYRPKDVFEFRPFMADKVELVRDGATFAFQRSRDKDGKDTWTLAAPAKTIDGPKMDALLSSLSGLQVASWTDTKAATGAETPALTVTVTFDDGKKKTERVVFGRVGTDVLAVRPGEPGAARVEAAKFDEAVAALDAVK